ncbi:MAG: DUF3336 domain-containing protein [Rhodoferax sp.]|nr:DUF3336 domain-containing protein [Rhodoferax sp.]
MEHLDEWKSGPSSKFYQHKLIAQRLINLKNWRKASDWPQLIFQPARGPAPPTWAT